MKNYETIVIFHPEVEKEAQDTVAAKVKEIVTSCHGTEEEITMNVWGKRKLAYLVQKQDHGFYVQFNYKADGEVVEKLATLFRVTDNVIKSMTVLDENQG